jgi:hypothetical protein
VKQVVIDTEADKSASNDGEFTPHEELRTETHTPAPEQQGGISEAEVESEFSASNL